MKKTFIAFTEQGRVKGKISGSILKKENGFEMIAEMQFPSGMHKGIKAEVISKLVEAGELPETVLGAGGYPNYSVVNELADILIIEGKGLNYYSIV